MHFLIREPKCNQTFQEASLHPEPGQWPLFSPRRSVRGFWRATLRIWFIKLQYSVVFWTVMRKCLYILTVYAYEGFHRFWVWIWGRIVYETHHIARSEWSTGLWRRKHQAACTQSYHNLFIKIRFDWSLSGSVELDHIRRLNNILSKWHRYFSQRSLPFWNRLCQTHKSCCYGSLVNTSAIRIRLKQRHSQGSIKIGTNVEYGTYTHRHRPQRKIVLIDVVNRTRFILLMCW